MKRFNSLIITLMLAAGGITLQTGLLPVAEAAEEHAHDDHDDHEAEAPHEEEHDEEHDHAEGQATITPDAAARAGVVTEKAGPGTIRRTAVLTGRVILNRDRTYAVRARFPGVVKDVKVRWGQQVSKGLLLADIESNESLKTYSVYAPRSGVVLERNTNIGDVAGGDPLFVIADLSEVWAEFHVFPRDLANIREAQAVRVKTLEPGAESQGAISMMLPTADALSQTVIAIVPLANADGRWRPGMTVEGHVALSERLADLVVAEEAVQRMEDQTVVFVKEGENTYGPREVTLGEGDGTVVEVLSGLRTGDEVVSRNSFTIKADILKGSAEHSH
jgi:cobalt-zinc-cadmium efflux system membrane fusion protein